MATMTFAPTPERYGRPTVARTIPGRGRLRGRRLGGHRGDATGHRRAFPASAPDGLECGTCLVAAAHRPATEEGRVYLERAAGRLMEARYLLYLARRFGAVDSKRYRSLSTHLDRASREVAPRGSP